MRPLGLKAKSSESLDMMFTPEPEAVVKSAGLRRLKTGVFFTGGTFPILNPGEPEERTPQIIHVGYVRVATFMTAVNMG